ncbi:MAG: hypothetical protein ABIQ95_06170 [Bdellovibrionia bacterium]
MNFKRLLSILFVFLGVGCASSQKSDIHLLREIILYNLHYRRPPQIGARFSAEPVESDFESKPKPDSKFDCEPLKSLFTGIDLAAVRQCLDSVNESGKPKKILYKLKREITPFLKLNEDKETPTCFQKVLQVLPVPREIYFQALEGGKLSCYNSRIPIVAEEVLGISNYFYSTQVNVDFPLQDLPEEDEETILLLSTWVMAPFFNNGSYLESKIVTRSLCSACFGGKGLFQETDTLPPFWP